MRLVVGQQRLVGIIRDPLRAAVAHNVIVSGVGIDRLCLDVKAIVWMGAVADVAFAVRDIREGWIGTIRVTAGRVPPSMIMADFMRMCLARVRMRRAESIKADWQPFDRSSLCQQCNRYHNKCGAGRNSSCRESHPSAQADGHNVENVDPIIGGGIGHAVVTRAGIRQRGMRCGDDGRHWIHSISHVGKISIRSGGSVSSRCLRCCTYSQWARWSRASESALTN